jgi:squalene-associated FAD-dependent desaturase
MRAVVVGGGLAGLTAALDLTDAGAQVTVLEARPRLGGLTASFTRGELTVDTGQHVFLRCCTAYVQLLERLGVRGDVVLQDRLDVPVARAGRRTRLRRDALPVPLHLARGLLRYLGPLDAARAVPAALALARLDDRSPAVDAQSLGGWLAAHHQSPRAVEALWALLTVGTLNSSVESASLALAATVVRTGLFDSPGGADIGWSAVPLGTLHGAAFARALPDVRTSAKVLEIASAGALAVRTQEGVLAADVVVLATPPTVAAALAPAEAGLDAGALAALGSSPIVNVHVHYDRRVLDEPLLALPDSPLQWLFDRTGASGATHGQYLAASLSAAARWLPMRAADVLAELLPEIARVLPAAAAATVLDAFVTREPHATFRQSAGSGRLRPGAQTAVSGLVLAGAWTDTGWPATMEGAVRSGHTAAAAALAGARHDLAVAS